MDITVRENYGSKLRVRVCGICFQQDRLLLVNHRGLQDGPFWAPPGGGMEFGWSAEENLRREFREETGLTIQVGRLLFVTEFLRPPLHALELFYEVTFTGGSLRVGQDPELGTAPQQIQDVQFMECSAIDALPAEHKHGAFKLAGMADKIGRLNGYFLI